MKKYILGVTMALVLAVSAVNAVAAGPQGDKAGRFDQRDSNKDGKIDITEFLAPQKARMEADFKAADTNGDGALSQEEWKARNAARRGNKGDK